MTEKLDLEAIRREIDEADSNLINAFERRLQAVLRVAEYKKQNNLPVRDRARELKVIEKAQGKLRNKNYAPAVAGLMEEIMAIARKMEEQQISAEPVETVPLEVGCFGVEGSYSHKAMEEYFAGKNINRHYYSVFEDVVKAVKNGEIRLVYLMNDAVESFLVFGNARMTGVYKPDYEGEILADLSRQGREYILVVHQDDSVVTLFFETLSLEKHLYDYSRIGHFWVEGYEYLRQLEYRLAILRDKYDYIGGDSCNALEEKLSALVEFPPLNYCCYPAVPEKYIVPRENPWIPSEKAFEVMGEIARQAGDRTFVRWLEIYRKLPFKWVARKLAGMLHRTKHIQVTMCLSEKLREASSGYGNRSFGKEADEELRVLTEKARTKQAELNEQGMGSEVLREEPFTIARDSLGFKVYLMKWNKGRKDCTVEIEEI